MNIKGLKRLQQHVPELNSVSGLAKPLLGISAVFAVTSLFFLAADRYFAAWMPDGEILVFALGMLVLSGLFSQKERFGRAYGEQAYRRAFARYVIPGFGIIFASLAHLSYIAGPAIPSLWWTPWLKGLGYLSVGIGALLGLRTVEAAGFDGLLMLYVYYPEEGILLKSGIYDTIRHPIYAAAQDIGFGLALIHANWYALLVAVLLPLFYAGWIRLVEEPDLIKRFPNYAEYRRRVPAFWPAPGNTFKLWRLLVGGR